MAVEGRFLEVTTSFGCSVDCTYCPQYAFRAGYHGKRRLSLEDFNAAISTLPKDVDVVFSGFTEPFLNSDCTNMIESASKEHNIRINTTLVGMHEEDVHRLAKIPNITHFSAHLPDNKGNARIRMTEEYKNVLALALQELRITSTVIMNDDFDQYNNERAGLVKNKYSPTPERHLKGFFGCGKLERPQFVMLPNCDVVLCCMDFGVSTVLGNLLAQSYDNIIASPPYRKIQDNRYKLDGDVLCRRCASATPILEYYAYRAHAKTISLIRSAYHATNDPK